jgi:F-type H+-transporting ATPase subunit epsilon
VSEYVVTGGFAEVTPEGVTVIAERAMVKSDVTQADMDGIVSIAQGALDGANEVTLDAAIKMHAEVVVLAAALGLNAA